MQWKRPSFCSSDRAPREGTLKTPWRWITGGTVYPRLSWSGGGMKEIPQQQKTQRDLASLYKTTETLDLYYKSAMKKKINTQAMFHWAGKLTDVTALLVVGVNQELSGIDWVPRGIKELVAVSYVWQWSASNSNVSRETAEMCWNSALKEVKPCLIHSFVLKDHTSVVERFNPLT